MVNYRLQAHILGVVDNQINDRDPAFVYRTLNRLMKDGFPIDEAKKLIASVLVEEIYNIKNDQKVFDEKVYENKLSKLPDYYYEQLDVENDPCLPLECNLSMRSCQIFNSCFVTMILKGNSETHT